jgi:NAD-dependent deacetylase
MFFSGSGLSAGSGIPTFRGRGGLYGGMRAEDVLSAETLLARPALVHGFMDDFRQMAAGKLPNAAHAMIAAWKRRAPELTDVVTMNVDGLLEAAGCPEVVHLHGLLSQVRSLGNAEITAGIGGCRYWSGNPGGEPTAVIPWKGATCQVSGYQFRCPVSGSGFRPDVVMFGEAVGDPLAPWSYHPYYRALRRLGPEDALVVIGTRGNVVRVCHDARELRCLKILDNLEPADPRWIDESAWDAVIHAPAADAVPRIAAMLDEWVGLNPGRKTVTAKERSGV